MSSLVSRIIFDKVTSYALVQTRGEQLLILQHNVFSSMNVLGHTHSHPGIHAAHGLQIGHGYFKLLQNCYKGIHVIGEKNINTKSLKASLCYLAIHQGSKHLNLYSLLLSQLCIRNCFSKTTVYK